MMLRRWEAIHEKLPDAIPYDAEAIENRDWQEIHNVYGDIDDDKYNDLFKYITERYPSENNTVKEVENELYHTDN
ncbi:hypothetical protein [Oceanobacillus jeddahense]|uniref:Uncharacterized protein n=1 Tax=Oceanobacillus jeddahense TaxID=1462527 RepID=A0ABY5K244_9BACI|nr:hypothetical protein [Oceanobacillus jeddahense]UUI05212.1 hypothetical protein NP439_11455 [Oceanobacillus jeddahense]